MDVCARHCPETDAHTVQLLRPAAASLQQYEPPHSPDRHEASPVPQYDPGDNFFVQSTWDEYLRYSVDGSHVWRHW